MKSVFLSFLVLFSAPAFCQNLVSQTSGTLLHKIPTTNTEVTKFTYSLFEQTNKTYGYDILANGVLIFHQQDMPGKTKGTGFPNKETATKVAERIILKLKRPVVPPVVTADELKVLHIQ